MRGISSEECSDEWGWKMRETLVCAQGFNSLKETTCSGDSGNGLVVQESNDPVVYGIVSYGAPGCLGKPKVFTKVASYIDFIHSVTGIEIKT